jgi:hypothetical protein
MKKIENIKEPDESKMYLSPSKENIMACIDGEWKQFHRNDIVSELISKSLKTNLRKELIRFGTEERTNARDIAYKFMHKYEERHHEIERMGHTDYNKNKDIADVCRQIGNAISGSNALSGEETIQDRVERIVSEYLKQKSKKEIKIKKLWR